MTAYCEGSNYRSVAMSQGPCPDRSRWEAYFSYTRVESPDESRWGWRLACDRHIDSYAEQTCIIRPIDTHG